MIQRISHKKQVELLKEKLEDRTKYALLSDEQHPQYKENVLLMYDLCAKDWKFFVNNFVWLQNPKASNPNDKEIPYLLWDFQEKAGDIIVDAVMNGYDIPIDKSRDMGLTWLVLVILYWGWNFHKWEVLMGSRKFEEVDKKGDMGTLFQKLRYMIDRTPNFLFPYDLNHYSDKVGMLVHPGHGASIAGEGNNPDFGRSDRRKVAFLDEFTSWEQTDRAAWQGLSATTQCRIPVSTPNRRGTNCWFYQIMQDAKKNNKPHLSLLWDLHPIFAKSLRKTTDKDLAYTTFKLEETSDWLESEIERSIDTQSVAQEILINYEASMAGKIFPGFSHSKQVTEEAVYDDNLPLFITWDFGLDGTAILWIQPDRFKNTYNIIDEYISSGEQGATDIYHYIDVVKSKPYKSAIHYGDPNSGNSRSLAASGQSIASILKSQGFIFRSKAVGSNQRRERIFAGNNILKKVRIHPDCSFVIEMFESWQFVNPKSGNTTTETPAHNEYSHPGDAYTYFAWNYTAIKQKTNSNKIFTPAMSGVLY